MAENRMSTRVCPALAFMVLSAVLGAMFVRSMRLFYSLDDYGALVALVYCPAAFIMWFCVYPGTVFYLLTRGKTFLAIAAVAVSVALGGFISGEGALSSLGLNAYVLLAFLAIPPVAMARHHIRNMQGMHTVTVGTICFALSFCAAIATVSFFENAAFDFSRAASSGEAIVQKIALQAFGASEVKGAFLNIFYMYLPSFAAIAAATAALVSFYPAAAILKREGLGIKYTPFLSLRVKKSAAAMMLVSVLFMSADSYTVSVTAANVFYILGAYGALCGLSLIFSAIVRCKRVFVKVILILIVIQMFVFIISFAALPLGLFDCFFDFRRKRS